MYQEKMIDYMWSIQHKAQAIVVAQYPIAIDNSKNKWDSPTYKSMVYWLFTSDCCLSVISKTGVLHI